MNTGWGALATGDAQPYPWRAWRPQLALLAITLGAFALFTWRLDAKSIWWDESLSLYRAQRSVSYILSNRIDFPGASTVDLHPPLYFLLLRGITQTWGESDWILRFPSALWATLTVPLLYAMGRRLRGPRAGLAAALLGALSPFVLWYAQEARMYTMVTALGLGAAYCLWRAAGERRLRWALGCVAASAAAMSTQYLYALLLGMHALLAATRWPRLNPLRRHANHRRRDAILLAALGAAMIVMVATGRVAVERALGPHAGRNYLPLYLMLRDAVNSFTVGLSMSLRQAWPLDLLAALLYAAGLVAIWRRPPADAASRWSGPLLLGGSVLGPIVGMWLYSFFRPIYMGSRYVIMCSPTFYLGVALGLDALAGRARLAAALLLAVVVGGMTLSNVRYFTDQRYRTKEDYRSAAVLVRARERPGDLIVLTAPENRTAFDHYYRGELPIVDMPRVALNPSFDPDALAAELAQAVQGHERVWLVHCRTQHSDPDDAVLRWLDAHAALLMRQRFPSWGSSPVVSLYWPGSPVAPGGSPPAGALATFDGRLALRALAVHYRDDAGRLNLYTTTQAPQVLPLAADAAVPGATAVSVALRWYALAPVSEIKASLKLVDAQGVVWAQDDAPPFEYAPHAVWPVGADVAHESALAVAAGTPPGIYRLEFSLYEADSGRVWLLDAGGRPVGGALPLAHLAVGVTPPDVSPQQYVPSKARLKGATPVFGERLALLGRAVGPRRLQAGADLQAQLYWQAPRGVAGDLRAVVNWADASGCVWHTTTHTLTGQDDAGLPWEVGAMRRGILRLRVPEGAPAGTHTLHLLVYDAARGHYLWLRRGPILWDGRDLPLGEIWIE